MVAFDQTDGLGFRSALEHPGGPAERQIFDQDDTVSVVEDGSMGVLDHPGPIGNLGLRLAFPLMAAGEAFPLSGCSITSVISHIGQAGLLMKGSP
jgi:hypothetical protein